VKVNGQDANPGCYAEGHRGQYGIDRLAEICEEFDIPFDYNDDPRYWRRVADGEQASDVSPENAWDRHVWAGERLEDLLNEHTEGGYWTWLDGEFFLVADTPSSDDVDLDDINCDTIVAEIIDILINDGEQWTSETIEHVADALGTNGVPRIWEESFDG
jgi:hypothetical protein